MQSGSHLEVPVFVFPHSITFYLNDQSTHKQVLTFYNPYEFPVRFKVLCTAPDKYSVVDPNGSIKPKNCIDIVIRHNVVNISNCNVTDKFRIQMQDHVTKQVIGRKDIPATLLNGLPDKSLPDKDNFESLPTVSGGSKHPQQYSMVRRESSQGRPPGPNYIVLMMGVICFIALLLPIEGEENSMPLQLSFKQKLMFAYVLGLVTMAIFKP